MVHSEMAGRGHEQVTHFVDEDTGLRAIVAIHDTTLGPALGGTRMMSYETEASALYDVLRLSEAMTYKAAATGLNLGGGKAVIVGDPEKKTSAMMRTYGRMIDRLGGHYITSVDVNTSVDDMDIVKTETDYVVGVSDGLGDPSPVTARGVFGGLRACAETVYGTDDFSNRTVLVQGVGKVGRRLTQHLREQGATVKVSDANANVAEAVADEFDAEVVAPDAVYSEPCDIFAPCAIGGVINDETVPQLTCDIVAGGANNILGERRHAQALRKRGILYAPDYVINAGGLITVAMERLGEPMDEAMARAEQIYPRMLEMIELAKNEDVTVLEAADRYAWRRVEAAREPLAA